MASIACFVEKYNFTDPKEAKALQNFKTAAETMGHKFNFMFRENLLEIPKYDAVFIRATTDPLFTAYIVSKTAWELGLRVVDDPKSIRFAETKFTSTNFSKNTAFLTSQQFS